MEENQYSKSDVDFLTKENPSSVQDVAAVSEEALKKFQSWKNSVRYCANPAYLLREIAGDSILIPVDDSAADTNCMFSLNETCLYLWKLFQEPHTVDEVITQAKMDFDAPDEVLERDICTFTVDYLQAGLLKEDI